MITENLSTLKIYKLTQAQYERELAAGNIDPTALYLTPDEEIDLSGYVTIERLDEKANTEHVHDISDVNELQLVLDALNENMSTKADVEHMHEISDVTNLQSSLDEKVSTSRTINGKVLSGDITLYASDVGAASLNHTHDEMYYTEQEIDAKISVLNTSIDNIVGGTIKVMESAHAESADEAVHSVSADTAASSVKTSQDGDGNVISSTYETKSDATAKLVEAKAYADGIKNDLLNGAGDAYNTLKELGDLIDENTDTIAALETIAYGKADVSHTHNGIYYTETEMDEKISAINTSISNSISEAKSYSDTNLDTAYTYVDNAVAQKSQVQIITWEDDD